MNIYKKLPIIAGTLFLLSGCNIYRQMVIPTPYSPNASANLGTEASNANSVNKNLNGGGMVSETLNTEGTTNPTNSGGVSTKDKTIVQRIAFPESEYRSLATVGSGVVKGQIYVTTAGGNKVYGKNTRLYLNPVTSYSTQWFSKSYLGGAKMSKVDNRLFNYLKFTTSDSNGNFEFLNVPSGSYYLIGVVKCGTACGYDKVKNIRIAKKVSVFGSDIKVEDLSKSVQ